MLNKLVKISAVIAAGGALTAGLASGASAATTARPAAPSWHPVLSVTNTKSDFVSTVVATGKTSGWAFTNSGSAYERVSATKWVKAKFPSAGGAVTTAAASSPSNVWAEFQTAGHGSQLDHWNGRAWTVAKTFAGSITGLSVLGTNDVWAFGGYGTSGDNGVSHFNGHTWTRLSSTLQGGYAVSDRNVWAFTGTLAEHFDGRRWTATNLVKLLPAAPRGSTAKPSLTGVIALAPNNVYATGEGASGQFGTPLSLLHFNGHSWSRVGSLASSTSHTGQKLASDGKGGLWLVVQPAGPVGLGGLSLGLYHYGAGKLAAVTLPGGAAIASVSQIPGTAAALAGGVVYGKGAGTSEVLQYS
jgi:hypothetical protein